METLLFWKYFFLLFTKFLSFQHSSQKSKINCMNINKVHFAIYSQWTLKDDLCLPRMLAILFLLKWAPGLDLSMNLSWGLTHLIWNLLTGLVRKRYTSKVDTMSNLIKEGYFNLSTMLNLKSLWMSQAWEISKLEQTEINKGGMHLYDQAKFILR
jgi:hypothetical protein